MKIPNYTLKDQIGQGGMATVYRARHNLLDKDVALKIMSPHLSNQTAFQKSFLAEGRIVAKLEHEHIVRLYDIGVAEGHYYMAMQYLSGGDLQEKMAQEHISLEDAIRITRQIASALAYAHSQHYLHRDIKPSNILFHENSKAVLSDFGISKLQGSVSELTMAGTRAQGTPFYMSPEQITHEDIDHRSDIYSLGIVFYEMISGAKPFQAESIMSILHQHMKAPIPELPEKYALLQPIINKCLAKEPQNRYASAEELSDALDKIYKTSKQKNTGIQKLIMGSAITLALAGVGFASAYFLPFSKVLQPSLPEDTQARVIRLLDVIEQNWELDRYYDHSTWSNHCIEQLINEVGPYPPDSSIEYAYREIQKNIAGYDIAATEAMKQTIEQPLKGLEQGKLKHILEKKAQDYAACEKEI